MAEPPPIGGIEIEDALQELLAEETNRQPLNRSLVDTCCTYGDAPDEGVAGSEAAGPAAAAGSVGAVTAELEQLSPTHAHRPAGQLATRLARRPTRISRPARMCVVRLVPR